MAKKTIVVNLQSLCIDLTALEWERAVNQGKFGVIHDKVIAALKEKNEAGDSIVESVEEP